MSPTLPRRSTFAAFTLTLLGACTATADAPLREPRASRPHGSLLAIGGGLDDDQRDVFVRFLELARGRTGTPHIVVVTAASGDQDDMATGKIAALRTWRPGLRCVVVKRETPTADTVAAIDAATGLFFTGGDQKRIVERYRPGDAESPEWLAMQRLLDRGGVIAGSSAGLAMMGHTMLLGGSSAEALGTDGQPANPRVGPGMHFLPDVVTDSHFFERDRIGRLAAALVTTKAPLGLGISEDGCVEIDLERGTATGIGTAEALVVDVRAANTTASSVRGARAMRLPRGATVDLRGLAAGTPAPAPARPRGEPLVEPYVEEGQNRQLASWRVFARASQDGCWLLEREGWRVVAWPAGGGEIAFDVTVGPPTEPSGTDR
ncbi:MAG: cyanophycinase [Planctomycetes bacterium]|nr:cyanophycinase [Planctomycetota bacterium]